MDIYRQRIAGRSKTGDDAMLARRSEEIERKLRLAGVKAERAEFFRLARNRKLSEELMKKLVREADLAEARFSGP
jgi:CPA1 family monovalent cation:H+ antiporter